MYIKKDGCLYMGRGNLCFMVLRPNVMSDCGRMFSRAMGGTGSVLAEYGYPWAGMAESFAFLGVPGDPSFGDIQSSPLLQVTFPTVHCPQFLNVYKRIVAGGKRSCLSLPSS